MALQSLSSGPESMYKIANPTVEGGEKRHRPKFTVVKRGFSRNDERHQRS